MEGEEGDGLDDLVNFMNAVLAMLAYAYPETMDAFVSDGGEGSDARAAQVSAYLYDLYELTRACGDYVEVEDTSSMDPQHVAAMYWQPLGSYVVALHVLLDNLYNRLDRARAAEEVASLACDALRDYVAQEVGL